MAIQREKKYILANSAGSIGCGFATSLTLIHILHELRKRRSTRITDPNIIFESFKLLEENIGENICDFRLGKDFLDETPKVRSVKEKNKSRN